MCEVVGCGVLCFLLLLGGSILYVICRDFEGGVGMVVLLGLVLVFKVFVGFFGFYLFMEGLDFFVYFFVLGIVRVFVEFVLYYLVVDVFLVL